jgi:hypothetical protein
MPRDRWTGRPGSVIADQTGGEAAMNRVLYLIGFVALLSGCVTIPDDPSRTEFGVSTARPDAGTAAPQDQEMARVDWKANQICTRGYTATTTEVEPAGSGQQLVDMKLRCGHYNSIDFDFFHMNWSNLL